MKLVFHTNQRFWVGQKFDTRTLTEKNLSAVHSEAAQEVETLLDFVRVMNYPSRPARMESISVIPWPDYVEPEGTAHGTRGGGGRRRRRTQKMRALGPPSGARFCFYVAVLPGANTFLADEGIVEELVRNWDRLRDSDRAMDLAEAYWEGHYKSLYSMLVEGPVQINDLCWDPLI